MDTRKTHYQLVKEKLEPHLPIARKLIRQYGVRAPNFARILQSDAPSDEKRNLMFTFLFRHVGRAAYMMNDPLDLGAIAVHPEVTEFLANKGALSVGHVVHAWHLIAHHHYGDIVYEVPSRPSIAMAVQRQIETHYAEELRLPAPAFYVSIPKDTHLTAWDALGHDFDVDGLYIAQATNSEPASRRVHVMVVNTETDPIFGQRRCFQLELGNRYTIEDVARSAMTKAASRRWYLPAEGEFSDQNQAKTARLVRWVANFMQCVQQHSRQRMRVIDGRIRLCDDGPRLRLLTG